MAHEISVREDGTAEIASALQAPWHGLGVVLKERMTLKQAIKEAHTEWNVVKGSLYYCDKKNNMLEVPDKMYTFRSDTGAYFGTVGKQYTPIQQTEQADFLEALVGEGGVVECHGALYGGKQVFWTVKVPEEVIVSGNDKVKAYLILANGHDGSLSFKVFWSPVRVVCKNTLMAALEGFTDGISIRHTRNVQNRVAEAKRILGLSVEFYKELGNVAQELAGQKISDDVFEHEFLDPLIAIPNDDKSHTKLENVRSMIRMNFSRGIGSTLAGKTAWGAYNAVTLYSSHQMGGSRNSKTDAPSKRFDSIYMGSGRDLSLKAFKLATGLVPTLN